MLAVGHTLLVVVEALELEEEDGAVVVTGGRVVETKLEVLDFEVVLGTLDVVVLHFEVVVFGDGFGLHLIKSALPVCCKYGWRDLSK